MPGSLGFSGAERDELVQRLEEAETQLTLRNAEIVELRQQLQEAEHDRQLKESRLRHLTDTDALSRHVTALHEDATARHEASLYRVVRRFHKKFGHPVEHSPHVPDADQVRFRLHLITEEFLELLEAAFDVNAGHVGDMVIPKDFKRICEELRHFVTYAEVAVNLPEFVDAMGDLDWVVEGTRAVMGVLGAPVLAEIARANMSKEPAAVAAKDAHHQSADPQAIKPTKPPGWTPPDIRRVLVEQGWRP